MSFVHARFDDQSNRSASLNLLEQLEIDVDAEELTSILNTSSYPLHHAHTHHKVIQLIISTDWLSLNFFNYLEFHDVANLDVVLSVNHNIRIVWLKCPKYLGSNRVKLIHGDHIDWCINKNIRFVNLAIINPKDVTEKQLETLSYQYNSLKHLQIENTESLTNMSFTNLPKRCPLLETLVIRNTPCLIYTDELLIDIGNNCLKLVSIDLDIASNYNNTLNHVMADNYNDDDTYFEKNQQNTITISDVGLEGLLRGCGQNIKTFKLVYHNDRCNTSFKLLQYLGTYCPLLEYLDLRGIGLSPSLHSLETFASHCQQLKCIKLKIIRGLTDQFLVTLGTYSHLLEEFFLLENYDKPAGITNHGIQALIQGCGILKILKINAKLIHITCDVLNHISEYCPLLEEITLNWTGIMNNTLTEIGKLKKLKKFYFFHNKMITDDGIANLITGHSYYYSTTTTTTTASTTNNTNTNITNSTATTATLNNYESQNFYRIIPSLLERIAYIEIDGYRVTDISIYNIADGCPYLKFIIIFDNHHLLPLESIDYLVDKCKDLTVIEGMVFVPKHANDELKRRKLIQQQQQQQQQQR